MENQEFREIAHSGGKIIIKVVTRPDGIRAYSMEFSHCRPVGVAFYAVHILPPGIPVGTADLGGIGSPIDRGPVPGCFMAYIVSDSDAMFGQQCLQCNEYWRSKSSSRFCAYCGLRGESHNFLTEAHAPYIQQYSALYTEAINTPEDGEHVIDLDAVSDALGSLQKPPFYYAEKSQQNKFECRECGDVVDILGRFGYCSLCGTRNDLQELELKTLTAIRERINTTREYESCVRDAVAAFDSLTGVYVKELVKRVPLTNARKNRLESSRFHNLALVQQEIKSTFDIDLFSIVDTSDENFAVLTFHRRHVYEHSGGEAGEEYLKQSGDTSVRVKQALRETQETAHRIVGLVAKIARNLHNGFHELFPFEDKYIKFHKRK